MPISLPNFLIYPSAIGLIESVAFKVIPINWFNRFMNAFTYSILEKPVFGKGIGT